MHPLRNHKSYVAAFGHRVSGIALILFLPFHFWLLGSALGGADELDSLLKYSELPLIKLAEWGLVMFLGLHLLFGIRILFLEFTDWPSFKSKEADKRAGHLVNLVVPATIFVLIIGFIFLIQAW
ncbi:MAG: succinate dehydrogenase, cytochrome b556 subunit [Gammaproteobacteria bacterium]|nr:succinate dehydrogenase, cytochrome b556 subunit [Gammaproteobacteria bacterium]